MRNSTLATLVAALSSLAHAQTFDVATVKPAAPLVPNGRGMIFMSPPTGGPGSKDPGRIHYPNMTLKGFLMSAYNVKSYQISGPAWINTERYDLDATMPPDTTKEQFRVMFQNLLAERFGVKIHHESKELPMYSLILAKKTPKMKESVSSTAPPDDPPPGSPQMPNGPPKIGPDGFPIMPAQMASRPGIRQMMMPGRARLEGKEATMEDLASRLTNMLDKPVTDATGLTAKYDFILTYSPEGLSSPMGGPMPPVGAVGRGPSDGGSGPSGSSESETPPDLFTAIQADLGLKLDAKKGSVDLIVVDHAERTPIAN